MQRKYRTDDPPHTIKKVFIGHDKDTLLHENIFGSTEVKSVRVLYIFKGQVASTRSSQKNILKYAPCFVLLFREWMWTWTSDTWFFWTEEYWVSTEEETEPDSTPDWQLPTKVSGSSSVMSWKPLVFIRRIISSFVTSMEMDTTLFPNSFHQFNSLRGNFLCAWKAKRLRSLEESGGSIYQPNRYTVAATTRTSTAPAASLIFSSEMVFQQGPSKPARSHQDLDSSCPPFSCQITLIQGSGGLRTFHVIRSKPLCSTATRFACLQAFQMLNATQKSLASSSLILWLVKLKKENLTKASASFKQNTLQVTFLKMGSCQCSGYEIFTLLCPCVCIPHPSSRLSVKSKLPSNTTQISAPMHSMI